MLRFRLGEGGKLIHLGEKEEEEKKNERNGRTCTSTKPVAAIAQHRWNPMAASRKTSTQLS